MKLKMLYYLQRIAVLIAILLLIACTSPVRYNHIDQAARIHLDAVDTYLIVSQDKLDLQSDFLGQNSSIRPTGSLISEVVAIGVLANEEEKNKSGRVEPDALIRPILESMGDYEFAKYLLEKINAELKTIPWLNAKDLVLLRNGKNKVYLDKYQESSASANFFIAAKYSVSVDLSYISTSVDLIMFPKTDVLKKYKARIDGNQNPVNEDDNIYRNILTTRIPLKVEGLVKNRGAILAQNGAEKIKKALEMSADNVARFMVLDLERGEIAATMQ